MANRRTRLEVELTANDRASKVVRDVADDVDELEQPHDVEITADVDQADRELAELRGKLERLNDADKVIALRGNAAQLEAEIRRAERRLGDLDRYDGEKIEIALEARDNATKKLERVQAELRSLDGADAEIEIKARGLDDITDKLDAIPGKAGAMGSSIGAALTSPAAAIGATAGGLVLLGNRMADAALDAQNLANLTGDTVEQASRLNAVWGRIGDTKDLQDVLLQMNGVLADNAELAEQLGINIDDGATVGDRFLEVVRKVNDQIDDTAQRSNVMSELFGEEGVRQVNALLTLVGDLDTAIAGVSENRVVDDDDVESARKFKEQTNQLIGELEGLGAVLGATVLPVMSALVGELNAGFTAASEIGTQLGNITRHAFDGGAAHRNREYTDTLLAAEQAARDFDRTLLAGAGSVADVKRITADYGLELEAQNVIIVEWARAHDAATGSIEGTSAATEAYRRQAGDYVADLIAKGREVRDDMAATQAEADATAEALSEMFAAARGDIDSEQTFLDLVDGFDRVREARQKALDAEGTDEAREALRDYRREQLRLAEDVLDYLETLEDIPDETVTRIRALIDDGQYQTALGMLNELSGDRIAQLVLELDTSALKALTDEPIRFTVTGDAVPNVSKSGGPRPYSGGYQPPQIIIYNPPGTPAATATNAQLYNLRNGDRAV